MKKMIDYRRKEVNMAILLVNIEDEASMALNEFFDYAGHCYALSCRRDQAEGLAISLHDFYDSTVATKRMREIPVVFCEKKDAAIRIVGWYKKADIYSRSKHISPFLQGNIVANASEVVRLSKPIQIEEIYADFTSQNYNVIEMEDSRYDKLAELVYTEPSQFFCGHKIENNFARYPYVHINMDPAAKRNYTNALQYCESLAEAIMNDECQGIFEIKALELYARELINADRNSADGYYYLAMACYQLGLVKEAMKAIERAIRLEKEASDLKALKANILVSMGHYDAAIELYRLAAETLIAEAKGADKDEAAELEELADQYIGQEKRALSIKHQNSFYSEF